MKAPVVYEQRHPPDRQAPTVEVQKVDAVLEQVRLDCLTMPHEQHGEAGQFPEVIP